MAPASKKAKDTPAPDDARRVAPWQMWTIGGIGVSIIVQALLDWLGVFSLGDVLDDIASGVQAGFEALAGGVMWALAGLASGVPLIYLCVGILRLAVPLFWLAATPVFFFVEMGGIIADNPQEAALFVANGFVVGFVGLLALQRILPQGRGPIQMAPRIWQLACDVCVTVCEIAAALCTAFIVLLYLDVICADAAIMLGPLISCVRWILGGAGWALRMARKHWIITGLVVGGSLLSVVAIVGGTLSLSQSLVAACGPEPSEKCTNAYFHRMAGMAVS